MTRLRFVFQEGFEERKLLLQHGLESVAIPDYMHSAITRYVLDHRRPGGFLTALLKNDLFTAVPLADSVNSKALSDWVKLLYNYCPAECYGSEEAVEHWLENIKFRMEME